MRYIVVVLTLTILLAGAASAQVGSPIKIYGGVGFSNPSDPVDFSDDYKRSSHFLLGIGYSFFPKLEAIGKAEYHTFGEDIADLNGGKFKAAMFGVDAKFTLSLPTIPFAPYAIGGIGLASVEQDQFTNAVGALWEGGYLASQTRFYYDYGFGVQWKLLMGVSAFGQLQWVKIDTKDQRTLSFVEGIDTSSPFEDGTKFWAATVGVKLL